MSKHPRIAFIVRLSNRDLPPMTREEAKEWADTLLEEYKTNPRIHDPERERNSRINSLEYKFQEEKNAVGLQNIQMVKDVLKPSDTLTTFIKQSNDVIQNFTELERNLLKLYTTSTGYIILNTVLRGSAIPPTEDNKEFVKQLLLIKEIGRDDNETDYVSKDAAKSLGIVRSYVTMFLDMWKRVPPIQNEIQVYRGVQRGEDILPNNNQFTSTSTSRVVSRGFTKEGCCLLHITIKPGVRALYIGDLSTLEKEYEVLISPPFRAEIVKEEEDVRGFKVKHVVISPVKPYRKSAGTRRRKNGRRSLKRRSKH